MRELADKNLKIKDMESHIKDLKHALKESLNEIKSDNIAIAFSGGIDSSILAFLSKNFKNKMLYTVGIEKSFDIKNGKNTAKLLNLPIKEIIIEKNEIKDAIPKISKIIGTRNVVTVSYELPLYFVAKDADEEVLLCGQGADELFGGYAKYLNINREELNKKLKRDVKELKNGIIERKITNFFKKKLYLPFLYPKFVEIALEIPPEYKIKDKNRKFILRELGRTLGMPKEIVQRKKKAAQYSSGIMKTIKSLAKENNCSIKDYINRLVD